MNEDEKARAIDMLAEHIRETRPYLFQLSARHDEELELIAALAEATGSKQGKLACKRPGIGGNAGNQHCGLSPS